MTYLERFDRHQIVQHAVLLVSFTLLAITGLVILYRHSNWGITVVNWMGGLQVVRSIHMWAAYWMIGAGVYHLVWITYKRPTAMAPRVKDFRDFTKDMQFVIGRRDEPATYDKFSYTQKFEYWAAFWGFVIMILSGLVMAYPGLFPISADLVAAARIAHSEEAILAIAFIATWHMYSSHLRRRFRPFNKVVFTGRMAIEKARQEHPLWVTDESTEEGG